MYFTHPRAISFGGAERSALGELSDQLLPQKRVHRNRVSFSLTQLTVRASKETRFLFRGKEAISFFGGVGGDRLWGSWAIGFGGVGRSALGELGDHCNSRR
ncbi:hypothetical protein [[Phormidium] sp. ETS-05]|uniref:hypothetical protein n=1 Tax=[Phormidium] sp. ETS-05 TaxID=222819 RepID=UPI0018EF1E38|nr:hypothetical protein [[Phormidium] sp. ETS-05]